MNIKKHIPNTITLGNLFCGCLAIVKAFEGDLVWAAYLVGIALVLDFFDGFAARMLKVSSAIGADLDSLADMVTFGVVPGIVMFKMIEFSVWKTANVGKAIEGWMVPHPDHSLMALIPYFAFIIPVFSCIRLAKFNNDTRQSLSFIGVPTPASTMLICSLPLIFNIGPDFLYLDTTESHSFVLNHYFLCLLSLIMSILLISEIPLFALKFKNFSWADNKLVYIFLLVAVTLILTLKFIAIPLVIILYILLSIVNNMFLKNKV